MLTDTMFLRAVEAFPLIENETGLLNHHHHKFPIGPCAIVHVVIT